jgi:hypothetical protein
MEAAATTSDERWRQSRTLWGRFDVQAIYVARGVRWEPVVADGGMAGELLDPLLGEDIGDEPHGLFTEQLLAVRGHDAGGLLSPVLEGVQSQVGEVGGIGMPVNPEHPAFFMEPVEHGLHQLSLCSGIAPALRGGARRGPPVPSLRHRHDLRAKTRLKI